MFSNVYLYFSLRALEIRAQAAKAGRGLVQVVVLVDVAGLRARDAVEGRDRRATQAGESAENCALLLRDLEASAAVSGLFSWTNYDSRRRGVVFSAFLPTQFIKILQNYDILINSKSFV